MNTEHEATLYSHGKRVYRKIEEIGKAIRCSRYTHTHTHTWKINFEKIVLINIFVLHPHLILKLVRIPVSFCIYPLFKPTLFLSKHPNTSRW